MNNYDKKIEKIKERQKQLLEIVRYYVYIDSKSFRKYAKEVIEELDYNDKMGKKYMAVVNAQKSVKKYAKQIVEAKDADEVKEIRKKLNKSINLIKEEMKKRNISEDTYNQYCERAKYFRKRIAEDVRYLKRKEKIKEIKKLNKHIDDLSKDDLKRLRKLVKNELEYGKRNLAKYGELVDCDSDLTGIDYGKIDPEDADIDYYVLQEEDLVEDEKDDVVEVIEEVKEEKKSKDKKKDKKHKKEKSKKDKDKKEKKEKKKDKEIDKKETVDKKEKKEENKKENTVTLNKNVLGTLVRQDDSLPHFEYRSVEDYLEDQVEDFTREYHIDRIDEYTGNIFKNLKIFRNNFSKMLSNKEKSKRMIFDSKLMYKNPELRGYGDYVSKRNSIMHNIKEAMTTNVFRKKESLFDEEMDNSIKHIVNYCKNNNMEISYQKTLGSRA